MYIVYQLLDNYTERMDFYNDLHHAKQVYNLIKEEYPTSKSIQLLKAESIELYEGEK